jgi:hypothetical protein
MPNEQQELQLRVTLDDQASAQLQQIRQALASIGATSGGGGLGRVTNNLTDFEKALGSLSRSALGVGKTAVDLAKTIGPLPVALGTLVYQLNRSSEATKAWGEQLVSTANAARMAGIGIGDFKGIVAGMRAQGVSAESATAMIQKFTHAYGELMLQGSQRRQQLIQIAGPEFANNMMRAIRQIGTLRTDTEKLNHIRQMGENVYRNEMIRSGDSQLAAFKRDALFDILEVGELAQLRHNLVEYDETTKANMKAESESLEKLHEKQTEEALVRERIADILRGSIADQETWITNQIVFVETHLLKWMETESERIRKKGFWYNFFYFPGMADKNDPLSPQEDRDATEFLTKHRPYLEGGFDPGGGGGDKGRAPFDMNNLLGGGQVANEKTTENTSELTRLSRNIARLWNDPKAILLRGNAVVVPGYAGGGIIDKPTMGMVGEAGPEAIVPLGPNNQLAPSVVTRPTMAKIGNAGPVAVVPMSGQSGIRQVRHSSAEIASWQPYFSNPLADIEQEMQASRSSAREAIAGVGKQEGLGGNVMQAGKAAWESFKYLSSPISAIGHTTLGRLAGGAFGSRAGGDVFADAVSPFIPYAPSSGVESAVKGVATVAKFSNLLSLSGKAATRLELGAKGAESVRAALGPQVDTASLPSLSTGPRSAAQDVGELYDMGRSQLDRMMGNQILKVGQSGNIKIKHENAPPGAEVQTEGGLFDNAETETSRTFDVSPSARWRHPDAGEQERRKQVDQAPYQPMDSLGIRG